MMTDYKDTIATTKIFFKNRKAITHTSNVYLLSLTDSEAVIIEIAAPEFISTGSSELANCNK